MRRLIGLVPRKHVCRVVKEQTIWLKGQSPYNNVSLVPNLKTLENNVCWGLCWRVFFANNSSHALAERAHKWVEISLWLAFTRRESGPEALPAQWDWEQLPRRCQTLQDRGLCCWLDNTTNPTWEAIAEALYLMDAHAVAAIIRRKYVTSTTTTKGAFYRLFL